MVMDYQMDNGKVTINNAVTKPVVINSLEGAPDAAYVQRNGTYEFRLRMR